MKNYRTAQGKIVDMAALAAKNERTRAVGNMKVNARGDTIDANGKIILPVTQKVGERYQKTVGNRSAQPVKQKPPARNVNKAPETKKQELTQEELELESSFDDDLEIEQIKAQESKK
jgi:hypothetical protein